MIYTKKKVLFSLKENFCESTLGKGVLKEGCDFNIKFGVDCTKPQLTIGHSLSLNRLRRVQDLKKKLYLIIGSFTACIGDPTNKLSPRFKISSVHTYLNSKIYMLKFKKTFVKRMLKLKFNHQWLSRLNAIEFLNVLEFVKVNYLISRLDFKLRLENKKPLSVKELLYPVLQGYDSIKIKSDLEIGGSDQLFNMLVGRDIQSCLHLREQSLLTLNLLLGLKSKEKMSKSLSNCVFAGEVFKSIFSKIKSCSSPLEYVKNVFNVNDSFFIEEGRPNNDFFKYSYVNKSLLSFKISFSKYLSKNYKKSKLLILEKYLVVSNSIAVKDALNAFFKVGGKRLVRLVKNGQLKILSKKCFDVYKKCSLKKKTLVTFLGKKVLLC